MGREESMTGMEQRAGFGGAAAEQVADLSRVVIPLMRGVVYRDVKESLWSALVRQQSAVRDYVAVLGLDLELDESEGYAFLRSHRTDEEEESEGESVPRLVVRRQLSFQESLLLALLRRKLAECDAGGGDTRLVLSREQILDTARIFLPEGRTEARFEDDLDSLLDKVAKKGFVRELSGQQGMYEVRRIIKAFVDAQWLSELDERLQEYREHALRSQERRKHHG